MAIQPHAHSRNTSRGTLANDKAPAHGGGLDERVSQSKNVPDDTSIGRHIHLPAGRKYPPPTGTTGRNQDADYTFPEGHTGNRGLVLRDGVFGVDVDHHDEKSGTDTMRALVGELGGLPDTYCSTSRDPETGSGIWFFRVPAGTHFKGQVGPHVEVIQHVHRYAVVAPSVVDGRVYQWYSPELQPCDEPTLEDLPWLPDAWVEYLTATEHASRKLPAESGWRQFVRQHEMIDAEAWAELVEQIPGAKAAPCVHMADIGNPTGLFFAMSRRGAYESLTSLTFKAVKFGTGAAADGCDGGCRGLALVVQRIAAAYLDEVGMSGRRGRLSGAGGRTEDVREIHATITRSITGALKRVAA